MADPILIDDGGSLRIRQFPSDPALDNLLDGLATVNNPPPQPAFSILRVEHHSREGRNHLHPPGPGTTPLTTGDVVTIASFSGHVIQITINATTVQLDLTTGNAAVVEARSNGGNRTYRIPNADVIQTVTHSTAGVIFANAAASPSAFTVVAITDN